MDYDISPPWTLHNIVQAINAGILLAPYSHRGAQKGKSTVMVNMSDNYQRQSYTSYVPKGMQVVFFLHQMTRIVWYLPLLKSTSSILTLF